MMNDALGTDIDPVSVECPVDGSVHDTSEFREATGWEPDIDFREGRRPRPCALPRGRRTRDERGWTRPR